MADREAQDLLAQAHKKATSTGWFGGAKFEEAAELYTRAGNSFKLAKRWQEAGDAFRKAAEMHIKMNERDEAASDFVNASKSYKKSSAQDAINCLQNAIDILTERGRFHMAATHQKTIAEIYESDLVDLESAMTAYETAADWYAGEESVAQANNCSLKAAHFAAQLEHYDRAIKKFEAVAANSVDNQLTKWSLKGYFLKAGLCWLCTRDTVGAQRAIEHYTDMDITFKSTREYQLLQSLLDAIEAGDVELFTQKVYEYDQLSKLDNWMTTILLRVKRTIDEETSLT